jgi:ubiquinone/menaquinone biosynthesis C-methylase UbiE
MNLDSYATGNLAQDDALTDPFTAERYVQFVKHLPADAHKILDVGCSTGRGGKQLKELLPKAHLMGLDCVQARLDALPSVYDQRVLGLSNKIPLDDMSLDAIVAGEFLEHLYPADVDPTLCEFQRVLKVGGRLMMTTPHPTCFINRFGGRSVYTPSHLTQHYPHILKQRLLAHGFSKVKVIGSGKATRYFGEWSPLLGVYGSYLIRADKI